MRSVVGVFADNELGNERDKLHFLWAEDLFEFVSGLFVVAREVDQVAVGGDKGLVAKLVFEVDAQGFDAVGTRVAGSDAGQVRQNGQDGALVWRFFKVTVRIHLRLFEQGLRLHLLRVRVLRQLRVVLRGLSTLRALTLMRRLNYIALLNLVSTDHLDLVDAVRIVVVSVLNLVGLVLRG